MMNYMNQNEMNNQLMTNFEMDETAFRIKRIIDPYLNQINELQNIIQQKNFIISVLTEKLESYNRNQINSMNNNMNMSNNINMNFPQNLNNYNLKNINNNKEDNNINNNHWNIIFDYKKMEYNEMCNPEEKVKNVIKIWCNKYGIRRKNHKFIFNGKNLNDRLKICQSALKNFSIIHVNEMSNNIQNNEDSEDEEDGYIENKTTIIFKTTQGLVSHVSINSEESIRNLLVKYLIKMGKEDLIFPDNSFGLCYLFNATKLEINDNTKIKDFFKGIQNPSIIVNDINNLIGA